MRILCQERIRRIKGSFGFIEHRFIRSGFFEELDHYELVLYFFLILVSDRNGISRYGYDRICTMTCFTLEEYLKARNGLIDKDLLAFDGHIFQVLSLPEKPVIGKKRLLKTAKDMEIEDPATIRNLIFRSLHGDIHD